VDLEGRFTLHEHTGVELAQLVSLGKNAWVRITLVCGVGLLSPSVPLRPPADVGYVDVSPNVPTNNPPARVAAVTVRKLHVSNGLTESQEPLFGGGARDPTSTGFLTHRNVRRVALN
jgi:hypothetical protein